MEMSNINDNIRGTESCTTYQRSQLSNIPRVSPDKIRTPISECMGGVRELHDDIHIHCGPSTYDDLGDH